MKKQLLLTILLTSLLFAFFSEAQDQKQLSTGVVVSLTGIASTHGKSINDGIALAKNDLEKKGWKIAVNLEDDGTEPKRTVTAFQRLTGSGERFFIGPTWGFLAEPVRPILARSKSLSLQPCNSSDFLPGDNSRSFFFFTPPTSSLGLMTDFLKKYSGKKAAIINNTSNWGELWTRLFTKAAADAGVEIVSTNMFQFSEDFSVIASLLTKLRKDNVDLILSTTSKETTAETIKKMEMLQYNGVLLSPDLYDSIAEKLITTDSKFVEGYAVYPIPSPEFSKAFVAQYGREPGKYADSAYDALIALATAVEAVGNDADKVKEYFETKLDLQGMAGQVKFTKEHDVPGRGYQLTKMVVRK